MHMTVVGEPKFIFKVTEEELELLLELSRSDCDARCRTLSWSRADGAPVNGLLTIWQFNLEEGQDGRVAETCVNVRELDALSRLLEGASLALSGEKARKAMLLQSAFHKAAVAAEQVAKTWELEVGDFRIE
jgi:hypothetical protein